MAPHAAIDAHTTAATCHAAAAPPSTNGVSEAVEAVSVKVCVTDFQVVGGQSGWTDHFGLSKKWRGFICGVKP